MVRHPLSVRSAALLAVALVGLTAGPVAAQTYTANATGNWSVPANWNNGAGPAPVSATTTALTFIGSGFADLGYTATNNIATVPFQLNSITLNSTAAGTEVLDGNALQFAGTTPFVTQTNYGAFQVNNNLSLAATTTLTNTVATAIGAVTLAGDISGTFGITRNGANSGNLVYILSGNNAGYSGTTTVTAGVLRATTATALGTGGVSLGGGTLDLRATNTVGGPAAFGNAVTLTASSTLNLGQNGGGFTTFGLGTLTFSAASTLTVNFAPNAQASALNSPGFNNAFTSANFAGNVSLNAGTNSFTINGNTQTLGATPPQSFVRLDGALGTAVNAAAITKNGNGTLIVTTTGNPYTGINNLTGGTLRAQPATQVATYAGVFGTSAAANAINQTGGTLDLRLDGTGSNGVITFASTGTTPVNITLGTSANLFVGPNATSNGGNVVALGTFSPASGQTYTIATGNGYGVQFGNSSATPIVGVALPNTAAANIAVSVLNNFLYPAFSPAYTPAFVPGLAVAGTIAQASNTTGNTNFVKTGPGSLLVTANSTFLGQFLVRNGTTLVGADVAATGASPLGANATVTVSDSTGVASDGITALLTVGANRTVARPISVGNFGTQIIYIGTADANSATFSGTLTLGRQANLQAPAGSTATFSGQITGAGTLYKTGAGTAVVTSGTNNYSGSTGAYEGTLTVSGAGVIPSANVAVRSGGTLLLDNGTQTVSSRLTNANAALSLGGLASTQAVPYALFNGGGTVRVVGGTGVVNQALAGTLNLDVGASVIDVINGTANSSLTFGTGANAAVNRASFGAGTVDFRGSGTVNMGGVPLVNGLIGGYATVNTTDFATTSGGVVTAYTNYTPSTFGSLGGAADNVDLVAGTTFVSGITEVNTIRVNQDGQGVNLGGGTLRVTGGILVTANAGFGTTKIDSGTLVPQPSLQGADLVVHQYNTDSALQLTGIGFLPPQPRSGTTTTGSNQLTDVAKPGTFYIGQTITGTGIPANTTITAISPIDPVLLTATLTLSANATASGTVTVTPIALASGLTKAGPGVLELTGNNTYAGATTISGGTVRYILGSTAAPASLVRIASGATLDLNGTNQAVGSLDGFGTVLGGGGTLSVGGDNNAAAQTFAGQINVGTGGRLVKFGTGTQVLTNAATGTGANNLGNEVVVTQGILEVRNFAGGSNPLGTGPVTVIAAGGTLAVRADGNGSTAAEVITSYNNVAFTTGGVDAAGVPYSANGALDVNRITTTGIGFNQSANKTVQIGSVTVGRGILTISPSGNLNGVVVTGPLTLTDGAANLTFNPNSALTFAGPVVDVTAGVGNTLNLRSGGNAGTTFFGSTASTAVGGAYVLSGTITFGSQNAGATVFSGTANLGTGQLGVAAGAGVRFNGTGNVGAGSRVDAFSNLATAPAVITLTANAAPAAFGVRSVNYDAAPGFVVDPANARAYGTTGSGGGVVAVGTVGYTGVTDLRLLGNGGWYLGGASNLDGELANTNAQGLIPGAGNVYRLAGNNGGFQVANDVLHDMPGGASSLLVGSPLLTNTLFATGFNTRFLTGQSYTGTTQVGRNSTVEFRAPLNSTSYELFGNLTLAGNATLTLAQATAASAGLRPGGALVLDNTLVTLADRVPDATTFSLNSASLQLRGTNASGETVGAVSFAGQSGLTVARTAGNATLTLGNLTRVAGGILPITTSAAGTLGLAANGDRVLVTNAGDFQATGSQVVSGSAVVRPYIYDATNNSVVTYVTGNGFTPVTYTALAAAGGGGGTQYASVGAATTLSAAADVMALKYTASVAVNGAGITLRSGSLISTANTTTTLSSSLLVSETGSAAAPTEFYPVVTTSGQLFDIGTLQSNGTTAAAARSADGQVTAIGLTKSGVGGIRINSAQPGITGLIAVNQGQLELRYVPNDSTAGIVLNAGLTIALNGPAAQLSLRTNANGAYLYDQALSITAGVPTVTLDTASAGGTQNTAFMRSLTFGGAGGTAGSLADQQGQTLVQSGSGTVRFNGGATTTGTVVNLASGLNVLQNASTVEFFGPVVGPADSVLVKNGGGALTLFTVPSTSTFTTPNSFNSVVVNNGTLELRASTTTDLNVGSIAGGASAAAPSNIVMNGGTLNLRYAALGTGYNLFSNVFVGGNAAVSNSPITNAATPITVSGGLTIGNATFSVNGGNGGSWSFAGPTTLLGNGVLNVFGNSFNVNAFTTLTGGVTDGGRGAFLTKGGTATLTIAAAAASNPYSGGTIVNGGTLALPVPAAAGTGNITLNPSGVVYFSNTGAIGAALGNFATAGGQSVVINGSPVGPVTIGIAGNFNPNVGAAGGLNVVNNTPAGSGNILAIANGTFSTALNLGAIGNGRWSLGLLPLATSGTYTAATLGVGADNVYRLGAGGFGDNNSGNSTGTLTLSGLDVLTGAASSIQIGLPGYVADSFSIVALNRAQNAAGAPAGGVVVNRGSQLTLNDNAASLPVGTLAAQRIDVYGTLNLQNTQTRLEAGGASVISVFPGGYAGNGVGRLDLNNNGGGNRAGANANRLNGGDVNLLGGQLRLIGINNAASAETTGTINFRGGAQLTATRNGSGSAALTVTLGSRTAGSTLTLSSNTANSLGIDTGANFDRILVPGLSNSFNHLQTINGMAPAWLVSSTDNSFVAYNGGTNAANAAGFAALNTTAATAYQNTYSNFVATPALPTGLTTGAEVVNWTLTAGTNFIQDAVDVYALRLNVPTPDTATVAYNVTPNPLDPVAAGTIRVRSGGLIFTGNSLNGAAARSATIAASLNFADGSNTPVEGLIYVQSGAFGQILGDIRAAGVTKFGAGTLQVGKDITYNQGWTVNAGTLQVRSPGGLGTAETTNTVTLNGNSTLALNVGASVGNTFFPPGTTLATTPLNVTVTSGAITSLDFNTIQSDFGGQSDRTQTVSAITIDSWARAVNGTANSGGGSQLRFLIQNARNTLRTGALTLRDNGVVLVTDQNNPGVLLQNALTSSGGSAATPATGTTLVVAGIANDFVPGSGTDRTSLTKIGNLTMVVNGDNSTTFQGGAVNVHQGAVQVTNQGSLGSAATRVNVARNATLDIAVANYAPANAGQFTFDAGSAERWSVPNARPSGYALPAGVTWQLNTDHNPAAAYGITLNGGSIEGYLAGGLNATVVNRVIGANVTVTLGADSFVGQNWTLGNNGVDSGVTPNVFTPVSNGPRGAYLFINGAITGAGRTLTKTGYDTVTLAGANSYGNTVVDSGVLRIGAANSLPAAGALIPRYTGVFDLNGFNQAVLGVGPTAALAGTNAGFSGNVQNSAPQVNTLTVTPAAAHTYNGTITGGVALVVGSGATGVQNLTAANTYVGGSTVNGGTLRANNTTGSATGVGPVTVNAGGTLGGAGFIVPDTYPATENRVTFTAGSTLSPGNSIGTLTVGAAGKNVAVSLTSAAYTWEVPNTVAGVGTANVPLNSGGSTTLPTPQHDFLAITGSLTVANPTINVVGVGVGGFDSTATYSWVLSSFTPASLSGLSGTPTFTATNFGGAAASSFSLSMDVTAGRLYLNYQPVPEPVCVLLIAAGAAGAVGVVRRRNRRMA